MSDLKSKLVDSVAASMINMLNQEQMQHLRQSMHYHLGGIDIKTKEANIVPYGDSNYDVYKRFIAAKAIQGCSKKTLKYYSSSLKDFDKMINKPVLETQTGDVQYYIAHKFKAGVSKVGIDNLRRILSSFFRWCFEEEFMPRNPLVKIKKIKVEQKNKKPFSLEEIEKMRTHADTRTRAILEILLNSGCRVGEIEQVNISDVDFSTGEILVTGKGEKQRTVYINKAAQFYLQKYLESRQDSNPALFVSRLKPYSRLKISGIGIAIRELGRACGVANAHPHRCRRTFATTAVQKGMRLEHTQKILGHSKIETTMLYAQISQSDTKHAHEKYC